LGCVDPAKGTLGIVSTADEWDFTVPDDANELLSELRRHGVAPGTRLRVSVRSSEEVAPHDHGSTPRRMSFAGVIRAEPDLSERTDEYLSGFGRG
jgi:hypothetical protein